MPNSEKGKKATGSPHFTSATSSAISINPSAARKPEIKPEPSRGNLATPQPPGSGTSVPRQNSRRPSLRLGKTKWAGKRKRRGSGHAAPPKRRNIGHTYSKKQTK